VASAYPAFAVRSNPIHNDPSCYDFLMPTEHIVALLIAERDKLNRAIDALQGPTKRRGRPPRNPLPTTAPTAAPIPADQSPAPAKRAALSQQPKGKPSVSG
jgi:hypothetical protein